MPTYHKAMRGHKHPAGPPFAYCLFCSRIVVEAAGVWWHLTPRASNRGAKPSAPEVKGGES